MLVARRRVMTAVTADHVARAALVPAAADAATAEAGPAAAVPHVGAAEAAATAKATRHVLSANQEKGLSAWEPFSLCPEGLAIEGLAQSSLKVAGSLQHLRDKDGDEQTGAR